MNRLIDKFSSVSRFYSKLSNWAKILYFCILLLLLVSIFKYVHGRKEGYEERKTFTAKTNTEVYDNFYADVYDSLVYNNMKDDYEIGEIVNKTTPTSESIFLDIGSGTGHHVSKLTDMGFNAVGIDNSNDMVEKAKENYPACQFIRGDITKNLDLNYSTYTHVLCLYFTIYYMKDKERFFENCFNLLMPGGYLIIHLVDRYTFDPILPAGQAFIVVSPQKYAKKRITTTKVHFDDFVYTADFNLNPETNTALFNEKFKFKEDGHVRSNQHIMYMEPIDTITTYAQNAGFLIDDKIDLLHCGYDNQYLYILTKPN